ncbi:MAG: hypothetical protein ACM3VT_20995 [Solirubrobacterales bacterium]
MKRILIAVATALLAVSANAGEIKYHQWPTMPVPQEVTTIPVTMDVGYWIRIKDQGALKIVLTQDSIHTYSGCTSMTVETNANVTFSASIAKVLKDGSAVVPGDYTASLSPANINPPGGTLSVCAKLTNADLSKVAGGSKGVHVANVTVKVVPRSY